MKERGKLTPEEAIKYFERHLELYCVDGVSREAEEMAIKALEQEPILDKIRAEISEYGSLLVEYKIKGRSNGDIEKIVESVLKQAKEQVLEIIDKYRKEV